MRLYFLFYLTIAGTGCLSYLTGLSLYSVPTSFQEVLGTPVRVTFTDRHNQLISTTYENRWNLDAPVALHNVPPLLKTVFLFSEDKRFYQHQGIDWMARLHGLWTNLKYFRGVRGASTITEQVVRMMHPRPRTLWSKWVEGWEAYALEKSFSKDAILQFYLNQVPYGSNRRGIQQAARYYFNRDLQTLSPKEMIALAVLVRSPSRLDPFKSPEKLRRSVRRFLAVLRRENIINSAEAIRIAEDRLVFQKPSLTVQAPHFTAFARQSYEGIERNTFVTKNPTRVKTTLDGRSQKYIQKLLDQRLEKLRAYKVNHGAVLVADHKTGEVLVWAVGGNKKLKSAGGAIDSVLTPRQPGSTLKPFLYAVALEKGWTAATPIKDEPIAERVGRGLHHYRNYSDFHYGNITVREALGNSLNVPAIKAIHYVGKEVFYKTLMKLGFKGLKKDPSFYGDGLALGTAEVSLFHLVQAYAALARNGHWKPLSIFDGLHRTRAQTIVFSEESASIISHILSDPDARALEFGRRGLLSFPVQTAVKTGTSTDYRDAFAVGYNHRYVVGIWMGNLDCEATGGVTGSIGPAPLLRMIFDYLNRRTPTKPLTLSHKLVRKTVVKPAGDYLRGAFVSDVPLIQEEFFRPDTLGKEASLMPEPESKTLQTTIKRKDDLRWVYPLSGVALAYDPRLHPQDQILRFKVTGMKPCDLAQWIIDGKTFKPQHASMHMWPVSRGRHCVTLKIWRDGRVFKTFKKRDFSVQ